MTPTGGHTSPHCNPPCYYIPVVPGPNDPAGGMTEGVGGSVALPMLRKWIISRGSRGWPRRSFLGTWMSLSMSFYNITFEPGGKHDHGLEAGGKHDHGLEPGGKHHHGLNQVANIRRPKP